MKNVFKSSNHHQVNTSANAIHKRFALKKVLTSCESLHLRRKNDLLVVNRQNERKTRDTIVEHVLQMSQRHSNNQKEHTKKHKNLVKSVTETTTRAETIIKLNSMCSSSGTYNSK